MTSFFSSGQETLALVGGGNMATALVAGLLKQGFPKTQIQVLEPKEAQRVQLQAQFGVITQATPGPWLLQAGAVVWAVKPQIFKEVAQQVAPYTQQALHLSVAAGVASSSIATWLGTQRVVRAMPNTPASIGLGITALFAGNAITQAEKVTIQAIVQGAGRYVWFAKEVDLDAVTAISGSGPAYVFYFIEAMVQAAVAMGLTPEDAHQLAVSTFVGAATLAQGSTESPAALRAQVTSPGGTTAAALLHMEQDQIKEKLISAMQAAQQRARELSDAAA